jgi:hypothetical protein
MDHTTLDVDETRVYKREVDEIFLVIEDGQTMTQVWGGGDGVADSGSPWVLLKIF